MRSEESLAFTMRTYTLSSASYPSLPHSLRTLTESRTSFLYGPRVISIESYQEHARDLVPLNVLCRIRATGRRGKQQRSMCGATT